MGVAVVVHKVQAPGLESAGEALGGDGGVGVGFGVEGGGCGVQGLDAYVGMGIAVDGSFEARRWWVLGDAVVCMFWRVSKATMRALRLLVYTIGLRWMRTSPSIFRACKEIRWRLPQGEKTRT